MAKNEVATTTEKSFELVTLTGELAEAIAEEMDGLGTIPFERAKIPSGGGLAFELPGETEDEPVMSTELTGVILYHHPVNAYWTEQYSGGNEQPDCSSYDGKQGIEGETGEIHDCSKCPHNQFGSNGTGKACKNIHRCYILQEGNLPTKHHLHIQRNYSTGRLRLHRYKRECKAHRQIPLRTGSREHRHYKESRLHRHIRVAVRETIYTGAR